VAPRAGETWRQRLGRIAWLLAPAIAASLVVGRMTPALARHAASSFSRWTWFRSQLPALLHYARLFVWPVGQSADADYPVALSFAEPRVWLAALVLAAVLIFALRPRRPVVALSLGWFLLQLLPTSLFPLAEVVNEHRPYLASAGLCVLAAAGLVRAQVKRPFVAGLLAVLMILTLQRNRVWRSEESLWADVVAGAPLSGRAQMNYGLALFGKGKLAEAEPHLREAVRLWPHYAYAHINLGNWLLATGHASEALEHLDRAVALQPDLFWAPYYRGVAAERLNAPPSERAAWYRRALSLSPGFAPARAGLERALAAGGS
jgi:tetratricopeptide (TPR) repeat protein